MMSLEEISIGDNRGGEKLTRPHWTLWVRRKPWECFDLITSAEVDVELGGFNIAKSQRNEGNKCGLLGSDWGLLGAEWN